MTIIIDNTGFSVEHWSRFTEAEFIDQGMQQKLFKQHPDEIRRELLKQAYQIINDTPRTIQTAQRL